MRRFRGTATAVAGVVCAASAVGFGQMHKVAKPEDVVRAVGVYEWIGDRAKPVASRLIPVTLFIDGTLEDAGVYLSRPVPFALDGGTIYEVDKAGLPEGTVDLMYARHLKAVGDTASFDDGWFGYGKYAPPAPPKRVTALKASKTLSSITSSKDDQESDRPTFSRRVDHTDAAGAGADKTAKSPTTAPSGGSTTTAAQPPDDPDRPHLSKKSDRTAASDTSADTSTDTTGSAPASAGSTKDPATDTTKPASTQPTGSSDADRPTLKKRSPEEAKKARREAEQSSASGLATSLNDDPNRPMLHRGKGTQELTEADMPKLKGVPAELHQAVAVSDARSRPVHDFSRPWQDDAERATVLAKMQTLARAQIADYRATNQVKPVSDQASAATGKTTGSAATSHPASRAVRHSKSTVTTAAAPEPLLDESLAGYTLSYGGAATYVYTARTAGEADRLDYVTVVAQMDTFGELKPAIQSVTDAAHLDRTPWMRPVDVVDADASNRASLLFEMRGATTRQFALYRVLATRADQVFLTGSTQ